MIEGKESYNKIEIPNKLDSVFITSCTKAKKQQHIANMKKYAAIASMFLVVFLLCNNDTIYADTTNVPIIGAFVRFLHVGEGGKITDGVKGNFTASGGTLSVNFTARDNTNAPHYKIEYLKMPYRIVVTLNGVREFDRENLKQVSQQCGGVEDLYFLTVLDDSQVKFVITLKNGIGYEVNEYSNPASLEFVLGEEYFITDQELREQWIVRIPSMENGEALAMVQEIYQEGFNQVAEDISQSKTLQVVKTNSELYTVTAGMYSTREEAEEVANYLNQLELSDYVWYAEENNIMDSPK